MADTPKPTALSTVPLPRITIQFCTQCKWMLRAAYFAQELLSTFSTSLGEVALQPSTGGTFIVEIQYADPSSADPTTPPQPRRLWDRKTDGGFPETKELKRRVRDVIDPQRDLGHVDRDHRAAQPATAPTTTETATTAATTMSNNAQDPNAKPMQPRFGDDSHPQSGPPTPQQQRRAPWGEDKEAHPEEMKAPAGRGIGGVKPLPPKPPAESQRIIQERLDEAARQKDSKCEDCE